jgi:hypothetical protein
LSACLLTTVRVQLLPNLDESTFREMHEKDEMAVDKLGGGIDGFKDAQVCFTLCFMWRNVWMDRQTPIELRD